MNIYLTALLTMVLGFFIFQSLNLYQIEELEGIKKFRVKPVFAVLAVFPLIWFAWNREQYFGDTNAYIRQFDQIPVTLNQLFDYLQVYPKDPGYTIFIWIFKSIGLGIREAFLIIAMIQGFSLAYVYRKYSTNYFLSILLFFLSTDYYSWMENGIRQFLAVSIIFAAIPLILKKKYIPTIAAVLLASSFHQSALLMIPVIFIVQGKAFNKQMMLITISFLLALTFLSTFTDILDSFLQNTQYENVVTDYQVGDFSADNGTNPVRALLYSLPFLIAIAGYKLIRFKDDPVINLSANMSVFTTGFYLFSVFTSGIFMGRLPIYFSLYNYILLPWELRTIFKKSQTIPVTLIVILVYIIFFYIQMHSIWSVI